MGLEWLKFWIQSIQTSVVVTWFGEQLDGRSIACLVLVSAASGVVGQLVRQFSNLMDCYVVGSAGTKEKRIDKFEFVASDPRTWIQCGVRNWICDSDPFVKRFHSDLALAKRFHSDLDLTKRFHSDLAHQNNLHALVLGVYRLLFTLGVCPIMIHVCCPLASTLLQTCSHTHMHGFIKRLRLRPGTFIILGGAATYNRLGSRKSLWLSLLIHLFFPHGIDLYFDQVRGKMLDAMLLNMKVHGRITIYGMISQYNLVESEFLRNVMHIVFKILSIKGFSHRDHHHVYPKLLETVLSYIREKKIVYVEDVVEGLENGPTALVGLFRGYNFGKQVVKVV
ncbi:hypothetical protein VNO77_04540 [Canavalia gladiata]|uniref:Uncharacterized protein n=1 Tax=Canavalia gladiata TaxID=3824 RepID=A0AAN9N1T6_CANGL